MPFCELAADLALTPMDITIDNVEGLNTLEPFGMGNEKPVFIVENAIIKDIIPLSNGTHSKLRVVIGRNEFDALRFKAAPNSLPVKKGDICDMAVTLSVNNYMDRRSVNMYISDIRVHSFNQDKYFAALTSFEAFMRGEELPQAYYPAMLPTRDTAVMIYKLIPNEGITADNLYFQICGNVNYCRFAVAVEALSQLGLITVNCGDNIIRRVRVSQKADLDSAEILVKLRNISQKKG
jgi:single-stranded-DNA-specific exonuclease